MQQGTVSRSRLVAVGYGLIVSIIGLVGLPVLFGGLMDLGVLRGWLWLGCAVAVCVWLLAPAAAFAHALRRSFERLPGRTHPTDSALNLDPHVARLLTGVVYLVVLQAILRRPLVASLGARAEPFLVEAVFAVIALLVLLLILGWVYQVSRPLVEGLARIALDTTLATSGSDAATARSREFAAASRARSSATRLRPAPGSASRSASEATQRVSVETDNTLASHTQRDPRGSPGT